MHQIVQGFYKIQNISPIMSLHVRTTEIFFCPVCFKVHGNAEADNSVKKTMSFLYLRSHTHLPEQKL